MISHLGRAHTLHCRGCVVAQDLKRISVLRESFVTFEIGVIFLYDAIGVGLESRLGAVSDEPSHEVGSVCVSGVRPD